MEITMEHLNRNETARFEQIMDEHDQQHEASNTYEAHAAGAANEIRNELNRIALADLHRKRAKLGPLSEEQERSVEALFLSTIARIPASALLHLRATLINQTPNES